MIIIKSKDEISIMREAGSYVAEILDVLEAASVPGVSTFEIDLLARDELKKRKLNSPFLGYHGYPAVVCTSVNSVVVHGIPRKDVILKEGDILGIDFGVIYKGYVGDAARTIPIGRIPLDVLELINTTRQALEDALSLCVEGKRIWDIGRSISSAAEKKGYSVVRDFVGHGVGKKMHELPQVPNYFTKESSTRIKNGFVLAVEPMFNMGAASVFVQKDSWTVETEDRSLSAHFEHCVAVTEDGPLILSKP